MPELRTDGAGGTNTPGPLHEHTAIVTGGARGIGRATCIELARAGADVVVMDREADDAARVCREVAAIGTRAEPIVIDFADLDEIGPAISSIREMFGRVDVLVNCAAIEGGPGTVLDLELAVWQRTLSIDLTAPFLMMQLCAQAMIDGGRGGRIVNVTSSSAFRAAMTQIDYASAKAALVAASRSAAAQLAPHDINVNCVAPGLTVTSMAEQLDRAELQRLVEEGPLENLMHRLSMPEDVAAAVVFLCLPGSRQITAQTIHTSAGAVIV